MPTYTYKCTECDWAGDVRCAMDDRDTQTCDNEVELAAVDMDTGEEIAQLGHTRCGAPLQREEIPMDQGKMSYNWSKWQT